MSIKLIDFYTSVLESLGATIGSDGQVTLNTAGAEIPVVVREAGDRTLFLPTSEQLAKPQWDKHAYFHPLAESYVGGESEILHTLREMVLVRITEQVYLHGESLLLLAIDDKRQGKLKDNQMDVMKRLAETDETTISHFRSIISASTINYEGGEDRRLVAMYLKRGGNYKGRGVTRLCVSFFPVYDALRKLEGKKAKDCKLFGVDLRLKDVKILTALFEILFPNIEDDNEYYSDGTESRTAPYFTCLLNSYLKIAASLNQNAMLFSRTCKDLEKIQTKWGEHMDSLAKFNGEIPSLPFNLGTDDEVAQPKADDTPPWDQTAATHQAAPSAAAKPAAKEKPSSLMASIRNHFQASGADMSQAPRAVTVQQPQHQGNEVIGGWGTPAPTQPAQPASGGAWWSSNQPPAQPAQPTNNGWGAAPQASNGGWGAPPQQQGGTTQRVVNQGGVEMLMTIDASGKVVASQPLNGASAQPANNGGWGAQPANNGWAQQAQPQQNNGWSGNANNNGWAAPNNNGWGGNTSGGWQ